MSVYYLWIIHDWFFHHQPVWHTLQNITRFRQVWHNSYSSCYTDCTTVVFLFLIMLAVTYFYNPTTNYSVAYGSTCWGPAQMAVRLHPGVHHFFIGCNWMLWIVTIVAAAATVSNSSSNKIFFLWR
jgi:hypothetical protein